MSTKLNIYNKEGEVSGEIRVSDDIFGLQTNLDLIHQAMVAQMSRIRPILAHAKIRSEVRGGGKKPWRQKGTGRARAGSTRSPIWIGGGVTFGPTKDRNFSKGINKKMRRKAMFMVLSDKVKNNSLAILEKFDLAEFKTRVFSDILKNLEAGVFKTKKEKKEKEEKNEKKEKKAKKDDRRSILFVNAKKDEKIKYSGRNLAGIEIINLDNINILDLLKYRNVVFTDEAIEKLEKTYKKK